MLRKLSYEKERIQREDGDGDGDGKVLTGGTQPGVQILYATDISTLHVTLECILSAPSLTYLHSYCSTLIPTEPFGRGRQYPNVKNEPRDKIVNAE